MWAASLLRLALRHGQLIGECGSTRHRFVRDGYHRFSTLLERIVPYRRNAFLVALLTQHHKPYAKPFDDVFVL